MTSQVEFLGDILYDKREAHSENVLLLNGKDSYALYVIRAKKYVRVTSPIKFTFIDKQRNLIAEINEGKIILSSFIRSGPQGPQGSQGVSGTQGVSGGPGISGSPGMCCSGISGSRGPSGSPGASGSRGPSGRPAIQAYGYVYTISGELVISGTPVVFTSTGPLVGVTTTSGNPVLPLTGNYQADFDVSTTTLGLVTFGLEDNNVPIPGTTRRSYQSVHGSTQFSGTSGDVITLVNQGNSNFVLQGNASVVGPSYSYVQTNGGTSISGNVTSPPEQSSIYVGILAGAPDNVTVSSVTDSLGNTYNLANTYPTNDAILDIYYFDNITPSTTFTITVTFSTNTPSFSSMIPVFVTNTNTPSFSTVGPGISGTGTGNSIYNNITTSEPGTVILMNYLSSESGSPSETTNIAVQTTLRSNLLVGMAYEYAPTAGNYTPSLNTQSSTNFGSQSVSVLTANSSPVPVGAGLTLMYLSK